MTCIPFCFYLVRSFSLRLAKAQESTGVIDAFVDAVLRGGECVIGAEQVLPSMTVFFAALESAGSGKRIYL